MGIIINANEVETIDKAGDRKIILVGGCFDVLHQGHIEFLKEAKKLGGDLVVILESDENIKKIKGSDRPINNQQARAKVLAGISYVGYVVCLNGIPNDNDYEMLVKQIEPDIIAVTKGTRIYDWERRYVDGTNRKIVEVMEKIKDKSTTRLAQKIKI